jgi:O-antigen ligase
MLYLLEILFTLAPAYVWRFEFTGIPLNFLEIAVFVFWIAFVVYLFKKNLIRDFLSFFKKTPRFLLVTMCLFFLAGFISMLISPAGMRAKGLFIVFFLQPIVTYFPAAYILKEEKSKNHFTRLIFVLIGLFSAYGIFQYFTKIGLPVAWWGNPVEPKRALSFFNHPNAFAMWLGPFLALCLPFLFSKEFKPWYLKLTYLLGLFAFILSLSRAAWLAFAVVIGVFGFLTKDRRIRFAMIGALIAFIIVVASVPKLHNRIQVIFQGDKSTLTRFSQWHTANKMIKDSPILGKGLYGYRTLYDQYNTDSLTEAIEYPHNIFLNFWVDTGLLGLISFLMISVYAAWKGFKGRKVLINLGVFLFILTIFVQGQADHPYFKNDLALIFWIVLGLLN